ncbi:MAG TPA: lysylphosphatidylglycerol synthase transmembrane domain-containing protein [Polyangiaceae bacterium]
MAEQTKHKHRYGWFIGIAAIGVLALVWRHHAEPQKIAEVALHARPAWLFLAAALQLLTYPCIALVWANTIRESGDRAPPFWKLMRLSVAELFTDQTIPSGGMSGTVLVVASLKKRGVDQRGAMAAVTASLAGFYVAQLVAVLIAFAVLVVSGHFDGWEATVSIVAVVAAIVIPLPLAVSLAGAMDKLPARIRKLRAIAELREHIDDAPKDVIFSPHVFLVAIALRFVVIVLDGATLALCLVAVGSPLLLVHAISAYVLAYVVGSASFLPGGLGTFEVTSSTLLADIGAPFFAAAPATLLMRALSFWLPMVPGIWFVHREVKKAEGGEKGASAT